MPTFYDKKKGSVENLRKTRTLLVFLVLLEQQRTEYSIIQIMLDGTGRKYTTIFLKKKITLTYMKTKNIT